MRILVTYYLIHLGAVHMDIKGHKYVTFLQINVPWVMILLQKLGKFIWQGDIYLTVRGIYLRWRSFIWDGGHLFEIEVIYLRWRSFIWDGGHLFAM